MFSLQILHSYRAEEVYRVYEKQVGTDWYLVLEGGNYDSVKYVLINGMRVTDIALQDYKLHVRLPGILPNAVKTVYPISETRTTDEHSILHFGLGLYPRKLGGITRLVQLFLKVLFTTPGSNVVFRAMGGGLGKITKSGYTMGQADKIVPDIVAAVNKTVRDVQEMQTGLRIPLEEKLVGAKLLAISQEPNSGAINGTLQIIAQKGPATGISLAF